MNLGSLEITQKQWGWSTCEVRNLLCEVHRIDVKAGGHCSWHQHRERENVFSVANGRLLIEYRDQRGEVKQVLLQPGDTCTIPAGTAHRFVAPFEPVRAFEVYYSNNERGPWLVQNDIVRYEQGGIYKPNQHGGTPE